MSLQKSMSEKCAVCQKKAIYGCGHGCEATYCGTACARSVYKVHKEMHCTGLIGVENAETLIQRINYGSPRQTYENAQRYYGYVKQQVDAYVRLNAFQKRFNKSSIQQSVNDLVTALGYVIANRRDLSQDNMRTNIVNLRNSILQQAKLALGQIEEEIGEGVADFNNDITYLKSFDLNKEESRTNVIASSFEDVKKTYEKERTKRIGKTGLIKKLGYFSRALTDLISKRSDLTLEEKKIYAGYVRRVDEWINTLKK